MSQIDPYRPPQGHVADPVRSEIDRPLARRITRLAAQILDGLILWLPIIIVVALSQAIDPESPPILAFFFLGLWFLTAFVVTLYLLAKSGQTVGKKAVGIRIVRRDGTRAGLGRIFVLRMLAPGVLGAVPILGPLFNLVDMVFIFREDRRCVHDFMADTVVVEHR